jgi:transcriptional regulator with XRE-family HTH domain
VVKNAAEIAKREGLTRARVCQLMRLLRLAPSVLADLEDVEGTGSVPSEARLRKLAGLKTPERQVAEYERLCAVEAEARKVRGGRKAKARPPRRGLQHLFERARRYHAMLESGEARSLGEIGRAEGVSGVRIGQIVGLLHLAPEIIAAVDVPAKELPVGVSERKLRGVARLRDRGEQLRAWSELTAIMAKAQAAT